MKDYFKGLNLPTGESLMDRLNQYYEHLMAHNKVMNLTAITDVEEVWIKHFYDSLTLTQIVDLNSVNSMLDIGSGAGFPGIVIKLFFPHIKLTIVDSLKKRIHYLESLVETLGLTEVTLVHDRAEHYVTEHRNTFDLVTARAVANLNILNELSLPYVKVGGSWIIMKSKDVQEELKEALKGITILGGKIERSIELELPLGYGERTLIQVKKIKENNAYPREFKAIKNKPL